MYATLFEVIQMYGPEDVFFDRAFTKMYCYEVYINYEVSNQKTTSIQGWKDVLITLYTICLLRCILCMQY